MKYIFPPIMVVLVFSTLCQAEQYKSRQSSQGTSVAVVLGQEITIGDLEPHTKMIELNRARMNNSRFDDWLEGFRKNRLNGLIFGLLLKKYARDNKIEPTNEDIEIFRQKTSAQEEENRRQWATEKEALLQKLQLRHLSKEEEEQVNSRLKAIEKIIKADQEMKKYKKRNQAEARKMEENIAKRFVRSWKVNKSLFDRYGGRVIFQQAGPEPIDAYRMFLEEHQNKGSFKIMDEALEASFWNYFVNDKMHAFYSEEEGTKFMNTPWWLMEKVPTK